LVVCRAPLLAAFRVPPALRPEAGMALIAAAVTYGVLNAYMLMASVLTGLHRLDLWNRIAMGTTLLQLAGVWVVLQRGGGLVALMVNTGFWLVVGALAGRIAIRRLAPEIAWDSSRFDRGLARRLLSYSAALQVINAGVLVQFQLDKVLFGSMLS